jgi:PhnB protein
MAQINPYLSFEGDCREVMNFYNDCLDGELFIQTVAESPAADQCPAGIQDHIMHSSITKNGAVLVMGSDMHRDKLISGNTCSLCVNCDSEEQVNSFFTKFSAGGKIIDPLAKSFWGATFGVLTDKFGRQWMFNYIKTA